MKLDYTDLTFEFFSAKYLNMWMQQERHIHAALQNPDAHGVRKGLAYFVVSRGFPDIDNEKVGKKIAEMLIKADRYVTAKTAPSRVMELAKSLTRILISIYPPHQNCYG